MNPNEYGALRVFKICCSVTDCFASTPFEKRHPRHPFVCIHTHLKTTTRGISSRHRRYSGHRVPDTS